MTVFLTGVPLCLTIAKVANGDSSRAISISVHLPAETEIGSSCKACGKGTIRVPAPLICACSDSVSFLLRVYNAGA
jgi:hypothetical protein